MIKGICPICRKEVGAKKNITLAFHYHIFSEHNDIGQEEQKGIIKKAKALAKKTKRHERKISSISKGLPKGLYLLREYDCSYLDALEQLAKCCNAHPNCKRQEECRRRYDIECNKWPVAGENKTTPTSEQPPKSTITDVPQANLKSVVESIEGHLSRGFPYNYNLPLRV